MRKNFAFIYIPVLGFFFLFFPSWIIQAIALLTLSTLLISFLYSGIQYSNVSVYRRDSILRAHRNQILSVQLDVKNRGLLPVHHVFVRDLTGRLFTDESPSFSFSLEPGEKRSLSYRVDTRERGVYEIGPVVISGGDPLGLFPWEKRPADLTRVIIYPRVLPATLSSKTGLPAGNLKTENRIFEDITRYRSLREYLPGDDIRRISWKVSARMGNLYCMDFIPSLNFPVLILLNLTFDDFPAKYRSHRIERAIEVAASLGFYFFRTGQHVGLLTSGHLPEREGYNSVPIRGGFSHAVSFLECLATIQPGSIDFSTLLFKAGIHIPYGSRVIVISPPLNEGQIGFLRKVRIKGYTVELFEIASITGGERPDTGFPYFQVSDYGDEFVEKQRTS